MWTFQILDSLLGNIIDAYNVGEYKSQVVKLMEQLRNKELDINKAITKTQNLINQLQNAGVYMSGTMKQKIDDAMAKANNELKIQQEKATKAYNIREEVNSKQPQIYGSTIAGLINSKYGKEADSKLNKEAIEQKINEL